MVTDLQNNIAAIICNNLESMINPKNVSINYLKKSFDFVFMERNLT